MSTIKISWNAGHNKGKVYITKLKQHYNKHNHSLKNKHAALIYFIVYFYNALNFSKNQYYCIKFNWGCYTVLYSVPTKKVWLKPWHKLRLYKGNFKKKILLLCYLFIFVALNNTRKSGMPVQTNIIKLKNWVWNSMPTCYKKKFKHSTVGPTNCW